MAEIYKPTLQERQTIMVHSDLLKVSGDGVFFSIQGEGRSLGLPAVFLRLQFCNLQCTWCDTKYTWDRGSSKFWQEAQDWSLEKAREEITRFPARRLVVTGGEPLLQQKKVTDLIQQLPEWDIEVETNGTVIPLPELRERCQFNVSPKLANSDNRLQLRYKPYVLKIFNALPKASFKFVVQSERDFEEIDQVVDECGIDSSKIIIMPEGTTQEDIRDRALSVSEKVKQRGWRLMPRLQVLLWGNQRRI